VMVFTLKSMQLYFYEIYFILKQTTFNNKLRGNNARNDNTPF